jgi:hypothetical protein
VAVAGLVLVAPPGLARGEGGGNAVLLASDAPLPDRALANLLDERDASLAVLRGVPLAELAGDARVLTDDLAPVDQLLTPYVVER